MTPFPYRVTVRWSEPDAAYVAEVPAVRGAGGDGQTIEEAIRAARESVEELLEVKEQHGDPIPPPDVEEPEFSGQVRLRMPRSLHGDLAKAAERERVSLNQLMVTYLARQLGWRTASTAEIAYTPYSYILAAERVRILAEHLGAFTIGGPGVIYGEVGPATTVLVPRAGQSALPVLLKKDDLVA